MLCISFHIFKLKVFVWTTNTNIAMCIVCFTNRFVPPVMHMSITIDNFNWISLRFCGEHLLRSCVYDSVSVCVSSFFNFIYAFDATVTKVVVAINIVVITITIIVVVVDAATLATIYDGNEWFIIAYASAMFALLHGNKLHLDKMFDSKLYFFSHSSKWKSSRKTLRKHFNLISSIYRPHLKW